MLFKLFSDIFIHFQELAFFPRNSKICLHNIGYQIKNKICVKNLAPVLVRIDYEYLQFRPGVNVLMTNTFENKELCNINFNILK